MADKIQKILTPPFRVSFPSVFKPRVFEGGDPKYQVSMLFAEHADLSELKKAAKAAIEDRWPNKEKRPKGMKSPFLEQGKYAYDGYVDGAFFIRATSKYAPGVVDQKRSPIASEERFYAGCWARATVNAFTYDTAGNRGVAFGLQNLQFMRDDEPFSGRTPPEDDFDELEDETSGAAAPDGDDDDSLYE